MSHRHAAPSWPVDPARDAAIDKSNAAVVQRCDAAVGFLLRLLGGLALVALGVWALLTYAEPCAAGQLCTVVPLVPLRRLRAGTPPPPERPANPLGQPAAHHGDRPLPHRTTCRADAALRAMHAAGHAAGHAEGERLGYVQGVRAGRLAGFVWGLLCGALAVALAFQAGYHGM